jgi:hypothetical protein
MPSTAPTVKAGLRNWLRTLTGLREVDGVTVRGAAVHPDEAHKNLVVLTTVTAPQSGPVIWPDLREETPTLVGYCVCRRPNTDDADTGEDAARAAAYALFAVIENALEADPSAGGVLPGPVKGLITEAGLVEAAGDGTSLGYRVAEVRWLLSWTSDI